MLVRTCGGCMQNCTKVYGHVAAGTHSRKRLGPLQLIKCNVVLHNGERYNYTFNMYC